jgi:hypothetical protein
LIAEAEAADAKACEGASAPVLPVFILILEQHRTGHSPIGWTPFRRVYFRRSLFQMYWNMKNVLEHKNVCPPPKSKLLPRLNIEFAAGGARARKD